jgi:hypothetical protein
MDKMTKNFGHLAAGRFADEMVLLKPGLGQAISAGKAAYKCNGLMLKALEWLQWEAFNYHWRVFVVNALTEVL